MKIRFIGTGSGKTSLERFHSSVLLEKGDKNLLIDTGDGVSRALLSAGVSFNSISEIVYTHLHPDHFTGLPSLIVQMKMDKRENPLIIYCHSDHSEALKTILKNAHQDTDKLKFPLEFKSFSTGESFESEGGIRFRNVKNSHLENSGGGTSLSYLIESEGRTIFYTGDLGEEQDLFAFKDKKINIIIAESTHIQVDKLIKAADELNADYLYLTHIADEEFRIPGSVVNTVPVYDKFVIDIHQLYKTSY
jgi:ribonuclease Z